ncbi:MAG TPA: MOSC domain-containing protein [Burkholderiaceae bacterium]
MQQSRAKVLHCYIKTAHGQAVRPAPSLSCVSGLGIAGDIHASSLSPRQILLVRQEDLDALQLPAGYLGENLCVAGVAASDLAPGARLHIGGAVLHVLFHCEPCAAIAPRVPLLRAILGRRGVLAVVAKSGAIAPGDSVRAEPAVIAAWPDQPAARVRAVIARIPPGKALSYLTLLEAAGLQRAYVRAMPSYLRGARERGLPAHRVVDSAGYPAGALDGAAALLAREGALGADGRALPVAFWQPALETALKCDNARN